jgi:hypothetical protein
MRKSIWVLLVCLFALVSCASLEAGAPIGIDRLASLTPKVSAKSDVLLALGEPSGTGATRFNPQIPKRGIWFYEHITSSGFSQKVTILLIFFDGDRYDGHYWFGEDVAVNKELKL